MVWSLCVMCTRATSPSRVHTLQLQVVEEVQSLPTPAVYDRHTHFINFESFGRQAPAYINVVRDPVDRKVSQYYFRRLGWTGRGSSLTCVYPNTVIAVKTMLLYEHTYVQIIVFDFFNLLAMCLFISISRMKPISVVSFPMMWLEGRPGVGHTMTSSVYMYVEPMCRCYCLTAACSSDSIADV